MDTATNCVKRQVTAQDWKEIEQKLTGFYTSVKLICDGYVLTLSLVRIDAFKNAIRIYVNGVFEGRWIVEDCEERRRFLCPKTRDFYSKKEKASFGKVSKKLAKEFSLDSKYTYYDYKWKSFRSLKSHLIKYNKLIELVENKEANE